MLDEHGFRRSAAKLLHTHAHTYTRTYVRSRALLDPASPGGGGGIMSRLIDGEQASAIE